jgi:hypothetical protein
MYIYENLITIFADKGCKLISSQEEIKNQPQKIPKVRFISACGHENTVFVNVFKNRNTGVMCKDCLAKRYKEKTTHVNNIEQEYQGFAKFKSHIEEEFDIVKVCDGALVDYAIKPKSCNNDAYLALQIKCTNSKLHNMYGFCISRKYNDVIIICIQIEKELLWIFDGNMDLPKNINITYKRSSKYDKFQVLPSNLSTELLTLYNHYPLHKFKALNLPQSICQQKEQEYKMLRETSLSFLDFIQPQYEGMVYDFVVLGKQVQEKLAQEKNNGFVCKVAKRAGTLNRKSLYQTYIKGDNHFYWVHLPDKRHFYVIPEFELLRHDIVTYQTQKGAKSLCLYPAETGRKHSWANQYLFEYAKPNIIGITSLIKADYTAIEEEVMYMKMLEMWDTIA